MVKLLHPVGDAVEALEVLFGTLAGIPVKGYRRNKKKVMESCGGCIGMQGMHGSIGRDMWGFEVEAMG